VIDTWDLTAMVVCGKTLNTSARLSNLEVALVRVPIVRWRLTPSSC
jgi:hypothetical protein